MEGKKKKKKEKKEKSNFQKHRVNSCLKTKLRDVLKPLHSKLNDILHKVEQKQTSKRTNFNAYVCPEMDQTYVVLNPNTPSKTKYYTKQYPQNILNKRVKYILMRVINIINC